jgi:hypothetical protein
LVNWHLLKNSSVFNKNEIPDIFRWHRAVGGKENCQEFSQIRNPKVWSIRRNSIVPTGESCRPESPVSCWSCRLRCKDDTQEPNDHLGCVHLSTRKMRIGPILGISVRQFFWTLLPKMSQVEEKWITLLFRLISH